MGRQHDNRGVAVRFTFRELIGFTAFVACWAMLFKFSINWFVVIAVTVLPALVTAPILRGRRQWDCVRTLTVILVLSCSYFMLYLLSIGPYLLVFGPFGGPSEFKAFYNPLQWLANNTPLHGPLVWWAELWY